MKLVRAADVEAYLVDDATAQSLNKAGKEHEALVCQKWLRATPPKRYIFEHIYGDLLRSDAPKRVLDVGGGLTGLTPLLAKQHAYTLVELLAHDTRDVAAKMMQEAGRDFIVVEDWFAMQPATYDIVIANDLFPNVDQRLALFIEKFLPLTKRMRLSLTYYDTPRFYQTKRVDADEYLCMLAWDSAALRHCLEKLQDRIIDADMKLLGSANPSVYPNGRQVCVLELRGGLDDAAA